MKRSIAMLLALVMCLCLFAGCGAKEEPAAAEAPKPADAASEPAAAESDKPFEGTVLHIVTVRDTRDTSTDESFVNKTALKMAEEATGIKVEWTVLDESSKADKIPALLASKDQPDCYLRVLDQATIAKNQDMFYDLGKEGLLETYAPNVLAVYEPYNFLDTLVWPNGAIYSLSVDTLSVLIKQWSFSNNLIRQDWLDQLGLEVPTTADELYNVLCAFRDNDMDGDGNKKNEIPMSFASDDWQGELWLFAGNFGLHGSTWQDFMHYKMLGDDGKVIPSLKTDNFRKYLEYFNMLYSEGLMDVEGFSQTSEQYEAKIANKQVGVYSHFNWDPSFETSFTFKGFDGVKVVRDGVQHRAASDVNKYGFVATADANIEALLTWWNALSEKSVALTAARGGVDGNSWEFDENGNIRQKVVESTDVSGNKIYTLMPDEEWMYADRLVAPPAMDVSWFADNPLVTYIEGSRDYLVRTDEYNNQMPVTPFINRIVSAEMTEARTDIELELFPYIDRFVAESIVYGIDDAKWEAHLKALEDLGYDDWIQWYQDVQDGNVY